MKKLSFIICLFLANAAMGQKGKWVDLFNGKDLNDWKISENPQTFKVEDGRLIVDGPRAHLYYMGRQCHRIYGYRRSFQKFWYFFRYL